MLRARTESVSGNKKPAPRIGWLWVVGVALVFAGWQALSADIDRPARYVSAELQVHHKPNSPASADELATFRLTQARMLTSPFVLQTALRNEEIAALELVKQQPKPMEWLERNLKVENSGAEFIRISFAGPATPEAAKIINAVAQAYLNEVASSDANHRRERLIELRSAQTKLRDDLRTNRGKERRLTEQLSDAKDPQVQISVEQSEELTRHLVRLRIEHEQHQAEFDIAQKRPVDATDIDATDERVRAEIERDPLVASCHARLGTIAGELVAEPLADADAQSKRLDRLHAELSRIEKLDSDRREKLMPSVLVRIRAAESRKRSSDLARQADRIEAEKSLLNRLEKSFGEMQRKWRTAALQSLDLRDLEQEMARIEQIEGRISDEIVKLELDSKVDRRVTLFRPAEAP